MLIFVVDNTRESFADVVGDYTRERVLRSCRSLSLYGEDYNRLVIERKNGIALLGAPGGGMVSWYLFCNNAKLYFMFVDYCNHMPTTFQQTSKSMIDVLMGIDIIDFDDFVEASELDDQAGHGVDDPIAIQDDGGEEDQGDGDESDGDESDGQESDGQEGDGQEGDGQEDQGDGQEDQGDGQEDQEGDEGDGQEDQGDDEGDSEYSDEDLESDSDEYDTDEDLEDTRGPPPKRARRESIPVKRFQDEVFVPGSGFKGADHYDRKF